MTAVPNRPDGAASATDRAAAEQEWNLRDQLLRDPAVLALVLSRFATVLGISTLSYGAMVYLATIGAPQIVISLMGATRYLAALLFGISGGALADAMSKRTAMVTAYVLQAAACFIVPTVWGTGVTSLVLLIFLTAMLGQIVVPALKAMTALVATAAHVAAVAALITVASGIGTAIGTAFLAPILINVTSLRVLIYVTGFILLFGAVRTLKLPKEEHSTPLPRAVRAVDWRGSVPTLRRTAEWLNGNRKVGAMILVGSMVFALFDGLNTLIPVYVRDVLRSDPTNSVYILAPGGIGFLAGSVLGPWLMDRRGERTLAVMAMAILSLGFMLFGLIDLVAPLLAPISPLRLLGLVGIQLTPQIEAVGLISILTALGSTSAGAAVQTYINRYVILARQAPTFGMQEVLDSALTLFAVLTLGMVATLIGSRLVFIVAPPLIIAVVVWLIRIAFRVTAQDPPEARAILHALFDTARTTAPYPPDDPASRS
ncbi:MAG: MFS transporter [Thermomicrobiales bacterium]|nr:MFS transporter [Thermomicrobiales bacterium]